MHNRVNNSLKSSHYLLVILIKLLVYWLDRRYLDRFSEFSGLSTRNLYCEKYRNFTWFPDVEILRKGSHYLLMILIRLLIYWLDRRYLERISGFSGLSTRNLYCEKTVISPDFVMWKFCGKAQLPHSFGRITRNYVETVPFHKISTPGNQVKLRYFSQCFLCRLIMVAYI